MYKKIAICLLFMVGVVLASENSSLQAKPISGDLVLAQKEYARVSDATNPNLERVFLTWEAKNAVGEVVRTAGSSYWMCKNCPDQVATTICIAGACLKKKESSGLKSSASGSLSSLFDWLGLSKSAED